jgi:hypothetical protein
VNARGRVKVMGVGQRLVLHAAHVGGVVVVDGADAVREALVPVYAALGLSWDPATVGALAGEAPGITWDRAFGAVRTAFERRFDLREERVPDEVRAHAASMLARFEPAVTSAP